MRADILHEELERLGPADADWPRHHREESRPQIFTAEDLRLRRFPPIRYIVPGHMAEGCTLLAGRPKLGKSWLMLDIALAVASGTAALGLGQPCAQGDVLYLALEDNQRRLQGRINKLHGTFSHPWPAALHIATEWPRSNEGGLAAIETWIENTTNPRLVIVDVLAMFKPTRGDRETLYEADYAAVKALQELAGRHRVAIVVVHHTRKSQGEGDPSEKISGTLGLSGAADAFLVLDRDGNGATLEGRGRDVEEVDAAVGFDRETCRWSVLGKPEDVRRSDERSTIMGALSASPEPMSPRDVADVTGISYDNVRQLLGRMGVAGEVSKVRRGLYACTHTPVTTVTTSQPAASALYDRRFRDD